MSKARNLPRQAENEARAVNTLIRSSPQKLNLVAEMIRGKKVDRALAELTFSQKRVAQEVKKTLESAIANAENNHGLDIDRLVVSEAYVGKRLVMTRFHARGRGRASRVEKKFSRLTVIVREQDEDAAGRRGRGGRRRAAAAEAGENAGEGR
jgi:large subunit ribosomal protein L22